DPGPRAGRGAGRGDAGRRRVPAGRIRGRRGQRARPAGAWRGLGGPGRGRAAGAGGNRGTGVGGAAGTVHGEGGPAQRPPHPAGTAPGPGDRRGGLSRGPGRAGLRHNGPSTGESIMTALPPLPRSNFITVLGRISLLLACVGLAGALLQAGVAVLGGDDTVARIATYPEVPAGLAWGLERRRL